MKKQPNDVPRPNKENTIPLQIAMDWASRWRRKESSYNSYFKCKAFNIPKEDLIELLQEDIMGVRAYLGVEKTVTKGGQNSFTEKLMFVGVDHDGKDKIKTVKGVGGELISDPDGDGDIYDFTDPCPDMCDPESPLNGGD